MLSVLHVIITTLSGGTVGQVSAACLFVVTCTLNGFSTNINDELPHVKVSGKFWET